MLNKSAINRYDNVISVFQNIQATIGLIGIICNILAIFVFRRKRLKTKTYSSYWIIIAWFENLILLHTFRHWSKYILKIDIDLISPFFCRFNDFQPHVAAYICISLECLITVDRFFIIVYQNRFDIVKRKSFKIVLISLIIAFSLLVNISLPLNYRLIRINETLICHLPMEVFKLNSTLMFLNSIVINVVINPILDLKIIYHIITSRGRNIRRLNRTTVADRKFAISAITINTVSLVIKLPFLIGNMISAHFNLEQDQIEAVFCVCLTIALLEKIDIFLINMLVNSVFRREFFSMIQLGNKNDEEIFTSSRIVSRRGALLPAEEQNLKDIQNRMV